ncbi:MAG: D-alanyl-D-alanine carboxypeptidase/D-alanyl-D-alanine-endopeptidase [Oligoflexia bacterium]|nr:D-alanyl-D-alanine carboxypeptidase/D-alanyl-D-alanine-endopeptidase [Oligoflexia bacterium]
MQSAALLRAAPLSPSDKLLGNLEQLARAAPANSGIAVFDLASGTPVFLHNAEKPLKPASVMKVLTSAVALEDLGPEFQFRTEFLVEAPLTSGRVQNLYVKGGGDPALTVEELWKISRNLGLLGVRQIDNVILDDSGFNSGRSPVGQRAYQTGSSALAFNHDSLGFMVCPTQSGREARVETVPPEIQPRIEGRIQTSSSEAATFTIDELYQQGGQLAFKIGGAIPKDQECETFYRSVVDPVSYLGQTFRGILKQTGVNLLSGYRGGKTPVGAKVLYAHLSPPLSEILKDLNHFSNNFIAEQLLYAIGAHLSGNFEREAGLKRLEQYLISLGVSAASVRVVDASGLSHSSRLSASAVARVLKRMAELDSVRPEFENSLSVGGRSGTLKRRDFGLVSGATVRGKTGTLDGVSSLAGYLSCTSGRKLVFAILINDAPSKEAAERLENQIVKSLSDL